MALTRGQRIRRFVDSIDAKLERSESTFSQLHVILKSCGWKAKGSQNLSIIQQALAERGIFTWPRLTTRVDRTHRIYFRKEPWEPRLLFANEADLRDFLVVNFNQIEAFNNLRDPKPEHRLRSQNRIDILCRGRLTDDYVVIELKVEYRDVVDQIGSYMREVDETLAKRHQEVRGIVITGRPVPDLALSHATVRGYRVDWLTYQVNLGFESAGGVD